MCVGVRGSGVKELTDVYPQVTVISYVSVQQRSECSVRGREREREREGERKQCRRSRRRGGGPLAALLFLVLFGLHAF